MYLLIFIFIIDIFYVLLACVAWRFCRAGRTSGVAAKFAREARENERRSREKKVFQLLPPQSPRGFSALARLYYLATKTAMLRRLMYYLKIIFIKVFETKTL